MSTCTVHTRTALAALAADQLSGDCELLDMPACPSTTWETRPVDENRARWERDSKMDGMYRIAPTHVPPWSTPHKTLAQWAGTCTGRLATTAHRHPFAEATACDGLQHVPVGPLRPVEGRRGGGQRQSRHGRAGGTRGRRQHGGGVWPLLAVRMLRLPRVLHRVVRARQPRPDALVRHCSHG